MSRKLHAASYHKSVLYSHPRAPSEKEGLKGFSFFSLFPSLSACPLEFHIAPTWRRKRIQEAQCSLLLLTRKRSLNPESIMVFYAVCVMTDLQ